MHEPLRFKPLWLAIGAVGLALLIYLSLTQRPHHLLRVNLGLLQIGDKIEHVAAFLAPTVWFGQIYRQPRQRRMVAWLLILLGALLEYLQQQLGGYQAIEYGDIAASTLGVVAGWLLLQTRASHALARLDACITNQRAP